ncbi:PIG-L deacetylase family protein [Rhodococcus sp. SGAir0479]|uniref:PIG-L deacetylase family protein n=1 Tax=Rhodococcus sp. SGAir0479 TaxID=2567884 RepID=UPI0010CD20AF|nr:PIG-L family deacetylase [Rhodococcus sp. SGAir0479]QCQ90956.1 PIG-L family deacetylase [Rhodococcus sp. SGAir0479]
MSSVERFAQVPTVEVGTPEDHWSGHTRFRHLDVHECPALVVVAPHPDDEVLGVGALASELADRAVPVTVVSVTDGEASHPGSPTLSPADLAVRRRAESDRAASRLGLAPPVRCGLPDGAVAAHEDELAERIRAHLAPGTWCAAPLRTDGHPDHEAAGRAAARAAHEAGAVLLEYPIWLWHWAVPGDPAVPWDRARTFPLTRHRLQAKQSAVAEFATQITDLSDDPADRAILPPHVLARLLRDHETVIVP